MSDIAERLTGVRERIRRACERAGRDPVEVCICAVAKRFGPDSVREAADAGLTVIGENRVQEAREKIPQCPSALEWHMVGHLQRNKVREAVQLFTFVHSVDTLRLLETVDAQAGAAGIDLPVCLEVNVSGEGSKYGLRPPEVGDVLARSGDLLNVSVVGLMTMPPVTPEAEGARPYFRQLRELRDRCRDEQGFPLDQLSMGMSDDFEVAIEEGATWVRLGTILFGKRGDHG